MLNEPMLNESMLNGPMLNGPMMNGTMMGRVAHFPTTSGDRERTSALLDRPKNWFEQVCCALRGHDAVLTYGQSSVFLHCTSCGHKSAGWQVGPKRYALLPAARGSRRTPYHLAFSVLRRTA